MRLTLECRAAPRAGVIAPSRQRERPPLPLSTLLPGKGSRSAWIRAASFLW